MDNFDELVCNLSSEERMEVVKILSEFSQKGTSKSFNSLIYQDYKEIPTDIITFIKDDRYLGRAWHTGEGKCKLFPYWEKRLKELFPDNLTTTYNNAILSGARGIGKSEIAIAICLYLMHRLMCLKDPYVYLDLKPTEYVAFAFMNITKILAEDIGIAKFQKTVQLSPWFMERGTITGRDTKTWNPPPFIHIIIGSQSPHVIGQPIYCAFFDEISFVKNQDVEKQKRIAIDMIDTATAGMKTRFIRKGKNPTLLILASSKRSEKSFLESHVKKQAQIDGVSMFLVDEPVWNIRPPEEYSGKKFKVALGNKFLPSEVIKAEEAVDSFIRKGYRILEVPVELYQDFASEIERSLCDFAGISSSELTKYISGTRISETISAGHQNLFTKDVIEVGNSPTDKTQYYDYIDLSRLDPALKGKPLFIHFDMSISGDKTGIAGTWISGKAASIPGQKSGTSELRFTTAFSVSVAAPKGWQVSFAKNREFVYWLRDKGFNIAGISSDTFQNAALAQDFISSGFNYEVISVDRVNESHICMPYLFLKNAIYEKRITLFENDLLIQELSDLERNGTTGKIDHPDNGCFIGDTRVSLVDGRQLNFYDLVQEYEDGKTNYVYSMDLNEHKIVPKPITRAWKTRVNADLVEVTLDNGEVIKCTPDHKFMLRNGIYCEAKDLQPNDSLMPLDTKLSSKGLKGYRLYYEPFEDKWHYEHRRFATEVFDIKYLVHHKNINKLDNTPTNLLWCSHEAHQQIHALLETGAQSPEAKLKRSESLSNYYLNNKDNPNFIEHNKKISQTLISKNGTSLSKKEQHQQHIKDIEKFFNIEWTSLSKSEIYFYSGEYSRCMKDPDHYVVKTQPCIDSKKEHIREIEKTFNVVYSELTPIEKNSYGVKLARMHNSSISERQSQYSKSLHEQSRLKNATKALQNCNNKLKTLKILFPHVDENEFLNLFGFEYSSIEPKYKGVWTNRYRTALYDIKNHKVVSVKVLSEKADTYDIEVQDVHNFALTSGIFVHNCTGSKDQADALCGSVWFASQHAEEYAYQYGEDMYEIMHDAQIHKTVDEASFNMSFEEELKNTFIKNNSQREKTPAEIETDKVKTLIDIQNGILCW